MALRPITDFASLILKPYINNQDKAYAANIAPVETSPATAEHTAGTQLIYNNVLYDVTADIAVDDALATTGAGANISAANKVTEQINSQKQALANEVLHFTSVACAATTGNFATVSDSAITADHVVVECVFANPSAITTDVTWTTSNGSLVLNGTCALATTATITIAKKGN